MKKTKRKIADKNLNRYIEGGGRSHRSTRLVPDALRQPMPEESKNRFIKKYNEVYHNLIGVFGRPMYADSGFILYCGDCCEMLAHLQKSSFNAHLTITSPPYNIGKEYERTIGLDEYLDWCSRWIRQIYEVTVDYGAFWLNVGYVAVPGKGLCVPISYLLWDRSPFYLIQEIVWKYGAGVSTKLRLAPRNEKWLFYVKNSKRYTFNLDDIRDPNVKYPNQKKNGKFRCNPLGKNPSDVWEFPKVTTGLNRSSKERTGHPAQFPLNVVARIVRASSNIADVVFDPFAGSCSAGIASVGLGRVFVGVEKEKKYCEMAIARYEEFKKTKNEK